MKLGSKHRWVRTGCSLEQKSSCLLLSVFRVIGLLLTGRVGTKMQKGMFGKRDLERELW